VATAAAAHLLATESEVITGEETDARNRVEVPDYD
jgi:hypothetical protein